MPPIDFLDYASIPGQIIVKLQEVPPHMQGHGFSLAALRKRFGGEEGIIIDPYHQKEHAVSLAPWRDCDPATQFAVFTNFIADNDFVLQHPEKFQPAPTDRPGIVVDTSKERVEEALVRGVCPARPPEQ
jgi:hypothetical protein